MPLLIFLLQFTVVHLITHGMGLWRATVIQQRVQRCSTAVTKVWFQREGWELYVLGMGGVLTLLTYAALLVCTTNIYILDSIVVFKWCGLICHVPLLQVLSCAHVPPAMSLLQLSPVQCHSLLQHWLVLWYTTVLWGRNVIARSSTLWQ